MGIVIAGLVAPGSALAQDVAGGTVVMITGVAKDDAFFPNRKLLKGMLCAVEEDGLHQQGDSKKWKGGSMTCVDGQNYYFYKVAVEQGYFGLDYAAITGHPYGQAAVSDSPWQAGARVQITGISPDDAHVESAGGLVGQACTVKDAPMESTGGSWFSGQLACDNGISLYFYQVSVVAAGSAPAPVTAAAATPAAPVTAATPVAAAAAGTSPWPAGKMVKIVDVAEADALYATKGAIVGRTCTVAEAPLVETGEGHYAGRLFCDDGKTYQAFKVKVAAP